MFLALASAALAAHVQLGRLAAFTTTEKQHDRAKSENHASNYRENDKFHDILPPCLKIVASRY